MKVIVYLNDADEMQHAALVLKEAVQDTDRGTCGFLHVDGKTSVYENRRSGTVVIRVQRPKETA